MTARYTILVLVLAGCGGGQRDAATTPEAVVIADAGGGRPTGAGHPGAATTLDLVPVNRPGELVVLEELLAPGQVTIVDFWASWCGPCKEVEAKLVVALFGRTGVVVRKIDVGDEGSPIAERYDIGVLPHLRIYDRDGVLVYALIGDNAYRAGELAVEVLEGRQSTVDRRQ